jgi:hypothetical protein
VIIWPQSGPEAGVCKADQVADKIIESNQSMAEKKCLELSLENRLKIATFLKTINKPLTKIAPEPEEVAPSTQPLTAKPEGVTEHACKHCGSKSLEIRYSFSYFFFCKDCEKNTAIKALCPTCGESAKLRKQKKEFFAECEKDAYSGVYFVNLGEIVMPPSMDGIFNAQPLHADWLNYFRSSSVLKNHKFLRNRVVMSLGHSFKIAPCHLVLSI